MNDMRTCDIDCEHAEEFSENTRKLWCNDYQGTTKEGMVCTIDEMNKFKRRKRKNTYAISRDK